MAEVSFVQTLCLDAKDFNYKTLEQVNGNASVISFEIGPEYNMGDVVVVLSEDEIVFHGIIGRIQDGWALATDQKDSLLPATVQ